MDNKLTGDMMLLKRVVYIGIIALAVTISTIAAFASGEVTVVQTNRSFNPDVIEVAKDTIIHFANEDEFIHQIYVKSDTTNFDSAEQVPGTTIDIPFNADGTFEVRCHIHPKMRLTVTVK